MKPKRAGLLRLLQQLLLLRIRKARKNRSEESIWMGMSRKLSMFCGTFSISLLRFYINIFYIIRPSNNKRSIYTYRLLLQGTVHQVPSRLEETFGNYAWTCCGSMWHPRSRMSTEQGLPCSTVGFWWPACHIRVLVIWYKYSWKISKEKMYLIHG